MTSSYPVVKAKLEFLTKFIKFSILKDSHIKFILNLAKTSALEHSPICSNIKCQFQSILQQSHCCNSTTSKNTILLVPTQRYLLSGLICFTVESKESAFKKIDQQKSQNPALTYLLLHTSATKQSFFMKIFSSLTTNLYVAHNRPMIPNIK